MVRKILGFLIAGIGLYIAFWGANFGLGVVIIGCTIVLMPVARKALSSEQIKKSWMRNKVDKNE